MKKLIVLISISFIFININYSSWLLDVETSRVSGKYCDVRIPGDTGDKISLTENLEMDSFYTFRLELTKNFSNSHNISFLISPLRVNSDGIINSDIYFNDKTFNSNSKIKSFYKFDSYRISYRYDFVDNK